jgi:signal transduction histidine kinase
MRGLAVFPIVAAEAWLGVIMCETRDPLVLKDDTKRQLQALTEQASSIIYNMRLLEEAQSTARQLRELDQLKSEFLASMSHELRTPLNSIIGYSELMIDGVGEQLDPMSLEDLRSIHSSGMYLLALINDVLDLAKIEAGRLELNRSDIDLGYMVPEIVEATRVLMQEKPALQLLIDIPQDAPTIYADPLRLRQIVWNLISNAIKFTEEGHIRLFSEQRDGWMHVGIEDTGIGIAPENHATIFDRFRQVDGSATRKVGGTGLGLAITRSLAQLHGGDLWVESELGKGSTFILKLPLSQEQIHEASKESKQEETKAVKADPELTAQSTEVVGD